jgi:hypothetical protein
MKLTILDRWVVEGESGIAAGELAPEDVTIWRGTMPLLGKDAGIPIYRPLPDWQDDAHAE